MLQVEQLGLFGKKEAEEVGQKLAQQRFETLIVFGHRFVPRDLIVADEGGPSKVGTQVRLEGLTYGVRLAPGCWRKDHGRTELVHSFEEQICEKQMRARARWPGIQLAFS